MMRKYMTEQRRVKFIGPLEELHCNKCGKLMNVQCGRALEGVFEVSCEWGYHSNKDGELHEWDMCENCYNELINGFRIKPVVENVELHV